MLRCPFCHEGVTLETDRWVACATCLARHHEACFGERGACASCGHAEALDPYLAQTYRAAAGSNQLRRLGKGAIAFAILAAVEAALGLCLGWEPVLWRVEAALVLVFAVAAGGLVATLGLLLLMAAPFLAVARWRKPKPRGPESAPPEPTPRWQSAKGEVSVANRTP
jgi:hypothetical protein